MKKQKSINTSLDLVEQESKKSINKNQTKSIEKVTRKKKLMNLRIDESSDDEEERRRSEHYHCQRLLHPQIETIHSKKKDSRGTFYLVKSKGMPFWRCRWKTESDIMKTDGHMYNKLKKFDINHPQMHLNPKIVSCSEEYWKLDRVLSCSEMFGIQHPKKQSELNVHLVDLFLRVIRILTNFECDEVYYGVFYIDIAKSVSRPEEKSQLIDFSVITNRIYLKYYNSSQEFWSELESMLKIVDTLCQSNHVQCDLQILNFRIKQVAKILFEDWCDFNLIVDSAKKNEEKYKELLQDLKIMLSDFEESIDSKYPKEENIKQIRNFLQKYQKQMDLLMGVWDSNSEKIAFFIKNIEEQLHLPSEEVQKQNEIPEPVFEIERIKPIQLEADCQKDNEINVEEAEKEKGIVRIQEQNAQDSDCSLITISNQDDDDEVKSFCLNQASNADNEDEQFVIISPSSNEPNKLEQTLLNEPIDKIFENLKTIIKNKLNAFEYLNHQLTIVGQTSCNKEKCHFLKDIDMSNFRWIKGNPRAITMFSQAEPMYLVKWKNLTYLESTWEKEGVVGNSSIQLKNFRKFSRAPDLEFRKKYQSRLTAFVQMQNLLNSQRQSDKLNSKLINELNKKLFFQNREPKEVVFSQKSQPVYKGQKLLKSFQLESLNWMIAAWRENRNIILADEMGLGKTIQAMSFINYLYTDEGLPGPYLIVAPLSTLEMWKRVFDEWTNMNSVLYYDAQSKNGRRFCYDYEFYHRDISIKGFSAISDICRFSVIITSYEVFIQDFDSIFLKLPLQHIIIDEAHKLKNRTTKVATQTRRHVCKKIFLLTGTPIQNNMTELWSLLNFIEPNSFPDLAQFLEKYESQMHIETIQDLQRTLSPYLLRRMKEAVEESIPPLIETIIDVELTKIQKIVYKSLYEKNKGLLQRGTGMTCSTALNNLEMQLRKCCNHPFTIPDVKQSLTSDCYDNNAYFEKLLLSSGKMIFLDKVVDRLQRENKKMLIFSQFTEVLKMLEEYFRLKGVKSYKIDGSVRSRDRQAAIDAFSSPSNKRFEVFLLSTKAGGVGINLVSAKTVIIYDSDWNPQNDVQAIARAHRIGQTDEVKVFRLITKNTYESQMFERSSKKLGLDQAILLANKNEGNISEIAQKLKTEEIETLLKKGILGLLHETEPELEIIDDRPDNNNVEDIMNNKSPVNLTWSHGFYKKKFVVENGEEKIHIDDPDFWKKVFFDKKSKMDNLEKDINTIIQDPKHDNLMRQKRVFLKLTEEIYRYIDEKIKSDGYSKEIETKFIVLLEKILSSENFHHILQKLALQTKSDILKSSRRIVPINEYRLNAYFNELSSGKLKDGFANAEFVEEDPNEFDSLLYKRGKLPPKSGDDSFQKKTKKSKREDHSEHCYYCLGKENLVRCAGICKKFVHLECFDYDKTISALEKAHNAKCLQSDFVCYFCTNKIAKCFCCTKIGLISIQKSGSFSSDYHYSAISEVKKCPLCPKFYHSNCIEWSFENQNCCPRHVCLECEEATLPLVQCIICPTAYHKTCVQLKVEKIAKRKVICWKHSSKPHALKIKENKQKTGRREENTQIFEKEFRTNSEAQNKIQSGKTMVI